MQQSMIKICGNHSLEDIKVVSQFPIQYIGAVFAPSKRRVNPFELSSWLKANPLNNKQKLVGVFVNSSIDEVLEVNKEVQLDVIQLHGNETVPYILKLKEDVTIPIWKAIHHSEDALKKMNLYEGVVDGYIIDSKVSGAWGGTGVTFNWDQVPSYIEEAERQSVKCFIAGGVNPSNVNELVKLGVNGIDLASGVEVDGKKDVNKINQLCRKGGLL